VRLLGRLENKRQVLFAGAAKKTKIREVGKQMKIVHSTEVEAESVDAEGAKGATIRELLTDREGAPTFAMRLFEVGPGGCTPLHEHPWEHEVFVLEGQGQVVGEQGANDLAPGDAVLVLPGEKHQFVNAGQTKMRMLCLIPLAQRHR